jgi:hypothetical protein
MGFTTPRRAELLFHQPERLITMIENRQTQTLCYEWLKPARQLFVEVRPGAYFMKTLHSAFCTLRKLQERKCKIFCILTVEWVVCEATRAEYFEFSLSFLSFFPLAVFAECKSQSEEFSWNRPLITASCLTAVQTV